MLPRTGRQHVDQQRRERKGKRSCKQGARHNHERRCNPREGKEPGSRTLGTADCRYGRHWNLPSSPPPSPMLPSNSRRAAAHNIPASVGLSFPRFPLLGFFLFPEKVLRFPVARFRSSLPTLIPISHRSFVSPLSSSLLGATSGTINTSLWIPFSWHSATKKKLLALP